MGPLISSGAAARAVGFAGAWAIFTLALTLASRPLHWGPGFANPLPYALASLLIMGAGRLVRLWLNEGAAPPSAASGPNPEPLLGRVRRESLAGARFFLLGTAAFNNFILLSLTYLIGIGISSLFFRKPGRRNSKHPEPSPGTYWEYLNLGKQEADAYYRPF